MFWTIGSPGMNFMPATVDGGVAKLPMADVTLPQEALERIGRGDRKLIAGIRPEDFEDAAKVDRETHGRGTTFNAKLNVVEAMGAGSTRTSASTRGRSARRTCRSSGRTPGA